MWRIVNTCEANAVQPSVDAEGTPEYAVWQVIGFVNTPQLVECLHSLLDTRDSIPSSRLLACNSSTQQVEAEGPEIQDQGHPQLRSESRAS